MRHAQPRHFISHLQGTCAVPLSIKGYDTTGCGPSMSAGTHCTTVTCAMDWAANNPMLTCDEQGSLTPSGCMLMNCSESLIPGYDVSICSPSMATGTHGPLRMLFPPCPYGIHCKCGCCGAGNECCYCTSSFTNLALVLGIALGCGFFGGILIAIVKYCMERKKSTTTSPSIPNPLTSAPPVR